MGLVVLIAPLLIVAGIVLYVIEKHKHKHNQGKLGKKKSKGAQDLLDSLLPLGMLFGCGIGMIIGMIFTLSFKIGRYFMRKSLWFPLLSSLGTMVLLYMIGFIFDLSILEFKIFQNKPLKDGLTLNAEIALLPIAIGLVIGFIVERIVKIRNAKEVNSRVSRNFYAKRSLKCH